MPRYAAVDIGSNSVRLLVADCIPGGPLRILAAEREVTRLGEGVFRSGRIEDQAIDFLCAQLTRMAQVIARHETLAIRAVATAAVRDANNQHEFIARASASLGAPIEVISGQEEARLIHLGVILRWPQPEGRILLVDVGGGRQLFVDVALETMQVFSRGRITFFEEDLRQPHRAERF